MSGPFDESDFKASFYYDLKFILVLIEVIFVVLALMFCLFSHEHFSLIVLVFLPLAFFLDLQETIMFRVPRYGWECSKIDYKLASAFLIISPLMVSIGYFLIGAIGSKFPPLFFLGIIMMIVPIILGAGFGISCYLDIGRKTGFGKRDKQIIEAYTKYSYFYPKIFRRRKTMNP